MAEGTQLDYRLLGSFEVWAGGEQRTASQAKQRSVLALLLLNLNQPVSADQLIELLWPTKPPGRPQTAIQGYVSGLRKLLGQATIETTAAGYVLHAKAEQLDLKRFERFAREGRDALAADRVEQAARRLNDALGLWRGPALADFTYEAWAQSEIARLEELRTVAREEQIEARLALGHHRELVGELETLIDEHPLRERPRGQLMLALFRSGRQAEALDSYQRARRALLEDLGIDPSAELQALYRQILNQDAALTVEPLPTRPPTNLPESPTPLIGREQEIAEVSTLLLREDVRLLTLTGPGGTGKTRLAIQAAANLIDEYTDGVYLVSFAPINDPALLLPTLAQTLGLREQPGESPMEAVSGYLRDKAMLLLLDNLEQIAEAGPDIAELLAGASTLNVLATSRAPLRLSGEHVFPVPPLTLPNLDDALDLDAASEYEAVRLFVARAQAVEPHFVVTNGNAPAIAEICVRVDGLPLAIELAAARVRVLSPQAMLARFDSRLKLLTGGSKDQQVRQQTLKATIEWSYDLLSSEEQLLFSRLGVFVGGCRIEAAVDVCDPDGNLGIDILDGLTSLVEQSLLRKRDDPDGEPRFWMLETIREYARERLQLSGSLAKVSARHAQYFLEVAETADPHLRARDQQRWIDGLASEQSNLRAALAWGLEEGELEASLRLTASLALFWEARGQFQEARRWFEDVIEASSELTTASRGRVLFSAGRLAVFQAEWSRAADYLDEAANTARETGDEATLALALGKAAWTTFERGALAEGLRFGEEALALARELADPWISAEVLNDDACMRMAGDPEQARRSLEESLAIRRTLGDRPNVADSLNNLGYTLLLTGDYEHAEALLEEGLTLARQIGDIRHIALLVGNLALLSLFQHQPERAQPLFAECITLCEGLGDKRSCLEALVGIAALAVTEEKPEKAARLTGAVTAIHQSLGVMPTPGEVRIEEQCLANARRRGGAAWASSSAEAQNMTLDDAIALALEDDEARPNRDLLASA